MFFTSKKTNAVSDEQAMQDVMLLLDDWHAPEPSPWFDARMMARFREEQQRGPESLFARLRDRWILDQPSVMKPLMVASMALLLAVGGGSYYQLEHMHAAQPASATVQDLQILDNNATAIQQMDQLLDDNDNNTSDASPQS